ncbi:acyl-CoA Delta(11) desaturase [Ceratina calcarata]|uniref:Acyl-CoA Delta(11) desaturase n=1 Tax=Ceratina calcarata TaxID=156304 RepID=A0AAJ7JAG5_9HYME|nr:acyl-CoA Delta(11) desaturase [Ceratina calcarata]
MSEKKSVKNKEMQWAVILWYIHLHVLGLYGFWFALTSAKWMTVFFTLLLTILAYLGVTVGAHRFWTHRAFEAAWPLRLFLMLCHTIAGVGPIYDWVLYHRLHHKYYGTDKDPFNHKKGFLYSHFMANVLSWHMDYDEMIRLIDMRDVEQDGYVWFQKKFYWLLFGIFGILLPVNAPLEYWDESLSGAIVITGLLRFAITTNISWLVASSRLIWSLEGKKIPPDSISLFFITHSFWPAYHYMIPWDWKCGEYGTYDSGVATFFIKMWNELGMVDYLRTSETEDIRDMLHQMAKKKLTLENGLNELEELSKYNAKKTRIIPRH